MGGAAPSSFLLPADEEWPEEIDVTEFKVLSKGQFSQRLFDDLKDAQTGKVNGSQLKDLLQVKKDCFLSYDWGADDEGRDNRVRVFRVNDWLKANGIVTWYHTGINRGRNTEEATEQGISNSSLVLVFVTKGYIDRVNTHDSVHDICQKEYLYSDLHKTPERMLAIVMDTYSLDETLWVGPLQSIAGRPFVDLSQVLDELHFDNSMDRLLREILAITTPLMTKYLLQPPETTLYVPHLALQYENDHFSETGIRLTAHTAGKQGTTESIGIVKTSGELEEDHINMGILNAVKNEDASFEVMWRWLLTYTPKVSQLSEIEALQRFNVINTLASGDASKRSKLGLKAAEACQEALMHHVASAKVAEHGCMALKNLAYSSGVKRARIAAIAGHAVISALQKHIQEPKVAENACNALYQFAMATTGHAKDKLAKLDALATIIEAMNIHITRPKVVEYACGAIWYLCEDHAHNKATFGKDLQACELVLQSIQLHMENSYQITQTCLGAIAYLAADNGANKVKLAMLGACDIVVHAMETHASNVKVAEMGCRAIEKMTKGNANNKTTFGNNGGGETLVATLGRHIDITAVMEVCCLCVHNLASSDPIAASMGTKGVCDALVGVLRTNREAGNVVLEALKASMRLSAGAVSNAVKVYSTFPLS